MSRTALACLALITVTACQQHAPPAPTPIVSSVTVTPAERTLAVGASAPFVAQVAATGGADASVDWSTDRPTIASVAADGTVTAHAVGTATVLATSRFDGARFASATVRVAAGDDDATGDEPPGGDPVDPPPPTELQAAFTVDGAVGTAPFTVTFDASSSDLGGRDAATFAWDLGDGSSDEGVVVAHTFDSAGRYTVRLAVSIADASDEASTSIVAEGTKSLEPMTSGRAFHGAVRLADDSVLVLGGSDATGSTTTALRFDPADGSFASAGTLAAARSEPATVLLPDGRALVLGGGSALVEAYDPASRTFTLLGSHADLRLAVHAFVEEDGTVVAFTKAAPCFAQSFVVRFDPAEATATRLLTLGNLSDFAVAPTTPGAYVIAGGVAWYTCDAGMWTDDVTLVRSVEPIQIPLGRMSADRGSPSAVRLDDGRVLITGNAPTLDLVNPVDWTISTSGATGLARDLGTAVPLGTGRVLLTGRAAENQLEVYDPATDTISRLGSFNGERYAFTATRLASGDVLLLGGRTNSVTSLDAVAVAIAE